jgi:hypothetical protein
VGPLWAKKLAESLKMTFAHCSSGNLFYGDWGLETSPPSLSGKEGAEQGCERMSGHTEDVCILWLHSYYWYLLYDLEA